MFSRRILTTLSLALVTAFASVSTLAADFSINPTRVELNVKKSVETITLVNGEDREVSFEVSLFKWTQEANGEWKEVPSKDLVVYPALFKMPANGKGIVRVGSKMKTAPEVEGTYRLSIQELPGGPSPEGTAVRLLTRVSLPIFIAPTQSTKSLTLSASFSSSELALAISNKGNVHTKPQEAQVQYLDASGKALGEAVKTKTNTDYVLPGATVTVKAPLPANCAAAKEVQLTLNESKEVLKAPLSGSCK